MTLNIALRRMRKEKMWSLAIAVLLTIGLTTWMVVPSISISLQRGLSSYANNVSTYMFVYNTRSVSSLSRLPESTISEIAAIDGIQEIYPIICNDTIFIAKNRTMTLSDGTKVNMTGAKEHDNSAVIGGQKGFPQSLITLSAGRLPSNESAFLINGIAEWIFTLNQTYDVAFPTSLLNENVDNSIDSPSNQYLPFNATAVGIATYNPMLQHVLVMWNSDFLQHQLGAQLFEQTFGGEGANYFIVKAKDIGHIKQVATSLKSMFADHPGYSVIYDEATVDSQLSFQSSSSILYSLIGVNLTLICCFIGFSNYLCIFG